MSVAGQSGLREEHIWARFGKTVLSPAQSGDQRKRQQIFPQYFMLQGGSLRSRRIDRAVGMNSRRGPLQPMRVRWV